MATTMSSTLEEVSPEVLTEVGMRIREFDFIEEGMLRIDEEGEGESAVEDNSLSCSAKAVI
jgi:hypothetical protein